MVAALALAALAALSVPAHDGAYRGERASLAVRDGAVQRVAIAFRSYRCDPFGQLGPLRVTAAPAAEIGDDGRVAFTSGPPSERLAVRARFRAGGRATVRARVRGTIGTGDPCRSPARRFVVKWGP